MIDSHWLCLDCGKDTFQADDYYMLRNKLWRQLVPREQRHGMLCLSCVSRRLGRPLQPGDFRAEHDTIVESDPEERPMELEDYGIIDGLRPTMLEEMDRELIAGLSSHRARKVSWLIGQFVGCSPLAIRGLPDYFYLLRIEQMIDSGVLVACGESGHLMHCEVRLA